MKSTLATTISNTRALAAALFMVVAMVYAQHADAARGDTISVGLVNCYPGEVIYELEGHTAIHVKGRYTGAEIDMAVNYGLFDFREPNFIYKFLKGETDYIVGTWPWQDFVNIYARQDRRIVEHPILMDSVQTARFMDLLLDNLKPENRKYRYNYALNNCSTKPLRLIEMALGDSITVPEPSSETARGASPSWYDPALWASDKTFRETLSRYNSNYPWYQFGIDLALGNVVDRPITPRQRTFAPATLDMQIGGATVGGRKLTGDPTVINEGTDATLPPTPAFLTPLTVFWVLFGIILAISIRDIRRRKVARWYDTVFFAIAGIGGCVIAFLVIVSEQYATSPNLLLMWLNPLCLIVPACIWIKKCRKTVYIYQIVNLVLIALMAVLWIPSGQKGNAAFIPLIACDVILAARYIYIYLKLKSVSPTQNKTD